MAIILSASCTLIECGTCHEQMLVANDPSQQLDRMTVTPGIGDFLKKHRDGCPQRQLVTPKAK